MSTNAYIGYINSNKMFKYVFCKYDNYIEYSGQILSKYYNSIDLVKELISKGSLASLGKYFNEAKYNNRENKKISKNNFFNNICECLGDNQIDFISKENISRLDCQYVYMFIDNKWKVSSDYGYTFLNLEDVINECKDDFTKIID